MRRITTLAFALVLLTGLAAQGLAQGVDIFEQDGVRDVQLSINSRGLGEHVLPGRLRVSRHQGA